MNGTAKPVITDETAQKIADALLSSNSCQREMRDLIAEQNGVLVGIKKSIASAIPLMLIPVKYDGESYSLEGITFAEIQSAISDGLTPVLQIIYGGHIYMIPFSRSIEGSDGTVKGYQFDTDEHNPSGTCGMFNIASSGKVAKSSASEPSEACKNMVLRLGGNVTESIIRERLMLVQSVVGNLLCESKSIANYTSA